MEHKWTPDRSRANAHNISPHYLASSTNIFADGFIRCLGNDLEVNREQLARELGFSAKHGTADELYSWCNSPGSTVFVLVSVLANLGRTDCVHKIEQYIHLQTMQLFVKVESAVTEQRPMTGSPLFYQIITSCEFSLIQTLENVLGQDVIYHEIVGPGPWVTWDTSSKELKGQQLTLLRHSQTVPRTRAALCNTKEPDTELKQPVVTRNIPAITDVTFNDETYVKGNLCTEMESLKYSQAPSIQASNSNNISLSGSLDLERGLLQSLSAEELTKTHNHPSLGSKDYQFTADQDTQVKELIDEKQNTPEYAPAIKHFPDKLLNKHSDSKDSNSDVLIHQALDNVPYLSLLNEEFSSLLPNIQNQPSPPSLDNKNGKFAAEDHTQVKTLIGGPQNTSDYPQVIKHFPDKLLYKDIERKDNKQEDEIMIQHALENVPRLSLLEEEFSSLLPNTQRPTLPVTHEEKQDKMNNLNCGASSSARISTNPQTISKTFGSEATSTATGIRSTLQQTHSCGFNGPEDEDSAKPAAGFTQTCMSEIEIHHVTSSLLPQGRNGHNINVPKVLASCDCFLQASCKPFSMQFPNSPLENDSPLLCDNSYIVNTPPQKRHRLGYASSSIPAEQQMQPNPQLQQQTLLDVQAMKLKQLQIQQFHQLAPVSQQTSDNDLTMDSQHYQPWPQQMQSQFHQDSEVHHQHGQHHNNYSDQNFPRDPIQNLIPAHQELEHQTFHLSQTSQQQFLYSQQLHNQELHNQELRNQQLHNQELHNQQLHNQELHNQESHQDIQPSNSTFLQTKPSPFLNSNASPYLLCHTPPPGFPEDQVDKMNHGVFEESERLNLQSQIFEQVFPNQETCPPSHFVGKLGHVITMNTREYMAMSQPAPNNSGIQGALPHNYYGQFIAAQNIEFQDANLFNPFLSSRNHSRSESRSDSSGISVDCPKHFQGDPPAVCFGQNPFITAQPFYPAPPIFDALGRRINASLTQSEVILRNGYEQIVQPLQDGNSSANKRQFSGCKSLSSNHFQASSMPPSLNQEAELQQLDGWCQHENGDTIQNTMEKFKSQDGNYIIWKSRRFKKLIISVSYLNRLFHFRVDEIKCEDSDRVLYYLFEGGYRSDSLLDLVEHYRQRGIRISMQSRGSLKTYIEHIQLRCPLKVRLEMKRKDTSRSK